MVNPIGTWDIVGNGYVGLLSVQQVDAAGNLGGASVYGNRIEGFWDERAQRITFIREIDPADPTKNQVYTGFVMDGQNGGSAAMAGSFEAFQKTGGTASRPVYGWYATPQLIG